MSQFRLPAGLTKLYLYVVEHRRGAEFRVLITTADSKLIVSDVDGTLTEFEYPQFHRPQGKLFRFENISKIGENPGASTALTKLHDEGYQIVYLTARPEGATSATRLWLRKLGFPDGVLLLSPTPWGVACAAQYKMEMLMKIWQSVKITAGIGNQPSDQKAYSKVLHRDRIFISLNDICPKRKLCPLACHTNELIGKACVFDTYTHLLGGAFVHEYAGPLNCKFPPQTDSFKSQ